MVKLFYFGKADVDLRFVQGFALVQQLGQAVQSLRPEHHIDKRCACDDGRALLAGHATADRNLHAFFLQVSHTPQIGKHFLLGFFTHRASVEHHQIGLVYVGGLFVALSGAQYICHLVRVVLVHLAAKGFDEDFAAHGKALKEMQRVMV